jgi:hypothetical protein
LRPADYHAECHGLCNRVWWINELLPREHRLHYPVLKRGQPPR